MDEGGYLIHGRTPVSLLVLRREVGLLAAAASVERERGPRAWVPLVHMLLAVENASSDRSKEYCDSRSELGGSRGVKKSSNSLCAHWEIPVE